MTGCGCVNLNKTHGLDCPVIRELKQTPTERMDDYRAQLRARQAELSKESAVDWPYKLQRLGVPADAILVARNPGHTRALESARRALAAPRNLVRALILTGARGAGKTSAAAFVLAECVKRWDWNSSPSGGKVHEPFAWCHASELTSQTDFGRVAPEFLERLRNAHVLVVDDLGKDATPAGLTALRDVMTHRHEKQRLTVVTANMPLEELAQTYGPSWFERLKTASIVPDLRAEKSLRKKLEARP